MEIAHWDSHAALAALTWQLEAGVTDVICDDPIDRFAEFAEAEKARAEAQAANPLPGAPAQAKPTPQPIQQVNPMAEAQHLAHLCADLDSLRTAMEGFEHCPLRMGAKQLVFAEGDPAADVMVLGDAPNRDADTEGRPFAGAEGMLLDNMFKAIGLSREGKGKEGLYVTNVLPWRAPRNRDPNRLEIDAVLPFLRRHIQLAKPRVIVLMGEIACQEALQKRGLSRLRGQWAKAFDTPVLPICSPTILMQRPAAKREAWADLLSLRAYLDKDT
ncbi:MAG: uracil-DNA glycosylase [Pseudomonadota bacterium]|nr:uracil-DNA glycosylase [Pseudomonadota bacterium]MEE3070850.1 uracil-DNA glycosylase [Pseudomonadota bacterium]